VQFQRFCCPATPVSIDEMMVRFTGRSEHISLIKSKPTPEGFKIIALCDKGYTFSFLYTSRTQSFTGLTYPSHFINSLETTREVNSHTCYAPHCGTQNATEIIHLRPTSRAVIQLCLTLPYQTHRFVLYCDNYFSNIPLFHILRSYGIAACGTARPHSAEYPRIFKMNQKVTQLPWNTISAVVIRDVLAVLWQDKTLVRFLTTAFGANPALPENVEMRLRKRPHITQSNRNLIESGWPTDPVTGAAPASQILPLPTLSVKYNLHMGGVDIADQRRSYYCIQLSCVRYWLSLFFWLLDVTVVNSYLLAQEVFPSTQKKFIKEHRDFRVRLAWNLVLDGARGVDKTWAESLCYSHEPRRRGGQFNPCSVPAGNYHYNRRNGYVSKYSELPTCRLIHGDHRLVRREPTTRRLCFFCRFIEQHKQSSEFLEKVRQLDRPRSVFGIVHRTRFECLFCKVPLCQESCFHSFHAI